MLPASKPRWQQVTALVSLSASGTVTGFSFVPSAPADLMSPTSMPIRLMALERSAQPAPAQAPSGDAALRSAIVNVARYYLRMAAGKTPAEMEAIIWQHDSIDGVDHGESCAAFASLTLELAAQVVGEQSWVTGGTSYPWPLHKWADVRVDPNPDSPNITSVLQDAEAHGRWHPLGDGYQPQPGDWVLFENHVEVVTKYADGVLDTIGGDSLPNFSVNAHEYPAPLAAQGVAGFVNNGDLPSAGTTPSASTGTSAPATAGSTPSAHAQLADSDGRGSAQTAAAQPAIPGTPTAGAGGPTGTATQPATSQQAETGASGPPANAAIPGTSLVTASGGRPASSGAGATRPSRNASTGNRAAGQAAAGQAAAGHPANADVPGTSSAAPALTARSQVASTGAAAIPGTPTAVPRASSAGTSPTPYRRHQPTPAAAPVQDTSSQQAFINQIVPGALATQRRYGIPAAVTIAQAIDESGWGQSTLAVQAHNLFGIKGTGPAGSDLMPTQEYENGQWVTINAPFRAYHNFAESIDDHGELLATSGYYTQAMSDRNDPNAFANALTGVYATNPQYGSDLIQLMQQYGLYRYDSAQAPSAHNGPAPSAAAAAPAKPSGTTAPANSGAPGVTTPSRPRPVSTSSPRPVGRPSPEPTGSSPQPTPGTGPGSSPRPTPGTGRGSSPQPVNSSWPQLPGMPSPEPAGTSSPQPQAGSPRAASTGGAADVPGAPAPRATNSPQPNRSAGPSGNSAGAPRPDPVVIPGPASESEAYQILPTGMSTTLTASIRPMPRQSATQRQEPPPAAPQRPVQRPVRRPYRLQLPTPVKNAFIATAKAPLLHEELLYRDVASSLGLSWELLAACDWMQCEARPRLSPVHGEKLGTRNPDGTVYHTRSEALEQCAADLVALAGTVYGIDLTTAVNLAIGDLARVFAAFRWGALLKQHHTSAMEFPYSVAGLTVQHLNMRWPAIAARAPDEPGKRFRKPFGAVPAVLSLNYPATV